MIANLTEPHSRLWTKAEYYRLGDLGFFAGEKVELLEGEIWVQYPDAAKSGVPYPSAEPHLRLWTKSEYYQLGDLGFFAGQKAELWEGEIVVSSPQNWPHASSVDRVAEVLRNAWGRAVWVRTQLPLDLGQVLEPEADVSVVPGKREDYTAHPTTALLIIEISDSTLATDRSRKGSLYARAGIADYWIVNLIEEQVEVYRSAQADTSQPHGHRYADQTILHESDIVAPLAAPQLRIVVAELLG